MSDEQDLLEQIATDTHSSIVGKAEKYSDKYFSRDTVIYFLAAGSDPIKAIKIGVTARNTVKSRLRSIQSSNHERIQLLKVIEYIGGDKPGLDAEKHEAELHKKFAVLQRAKAFTVGAEWFDWKEPLIGFIKELGDLPQYLK